ncbi:MAG: aminoacyl-histidine dipeptidase [Lachnospiraceae bacterium]|nr:aminoacyl-histidine dipeptidase [Lachnospiraceae bacterium]
MSYFLEPYDYKKVLYYFEELTKIPHGSGNVKAISDYLVAFAEEQGVRYVQDEALNVVMFKDATPGYESAPAVMIQGHMDMVCEKNADSTHDFLTDALELRMVGDDLMANGTTLGGDDGVAVAYAMALIADKEAKHPALELVITTEEETGMDGAKALDMSGLKASYLINVDSEDEGVVLCSCAGGMRQTCTLPLERVAEQGVAVKLSLTGLFGGHSGAEIDKNRVNSVYAMTRVLFELRDRVEYSLLDFNGGLKDNAIPREAFATVVAESADAALLKKEIEELAAKYKEELASIEPGFSLTATVGAADTYNVLHPVSFEKLLFFLMQAPNGIQRMSGDIKGLVESSLNLGIFEVKENEAEFNFSLRSSSKTYKYFMRDKVEYLIDFLGGESATHSEYPAWEYRRESKLRELFREVYMDLYHSEPKMEAIHAGLECGLIAEKMPDLDMISIGPNMRDIHTPQEALNLPSTIRMYQFLEKLLERMKDHE